MSILIKGMELPKDCEECRFCIGLADTEWGTCAGCLIDNEYREASSKSGCPLIEISEPHGALIDRDALNIGEYEREDDDTGTFEISLGGLLDLYHKVKDATTIIEAEGGENE